MLWRAGSAPSAGSPLFRTVNTQSGFGPIISASSPSAPTFRHARDRIRRRDHRLGELSSTWMWANIASSRSCRASSVSNRAHRVMTYLDPRHLFLFDGSGRLAAADSLDGCVRSARWPASPSTISPTPTTPTLRAPHDYALKEINHVWSRAAPMRCSAPRAAGRRRFSTSSRGWCARPAGALLFDDRDVTDLPTEARNIAQVFQFPVVYDTMTVRENLAFPLKNRGMPRDRRQAAGRGDRASARSQARARPQGQQSHGRHEAEDLPGARPRALRRGGDPVRRAADRHRPAPEMAASLAR